MRSQRRETKGKIHVEGQFFGDTTQALAARRSALAGQAAAMVEALNSSEGVLTFGSGVSGPGSGVFSGKVRIEEFTADLDQLVNAVNYAFTCSYTLFPDEGDYATAEWTAGERDDFTGQVVLTVAGKIGAPDEASARVKLGAILGQCVSDYGYRGGRQPHLEATPNGISANSDGDTFTGAGIQRNVPEMGGDKPDRRNQKPEFRSRNSAGERAYMEGSGGYDTVQSVAVAAGKDRGRH